MYSGLGFREELGTTGLSWKGLVDLSETFSDFWVEPFLQRLVKPFVDQR